MASPLPVSKEQVRSLPSKLLFLIVAGITIAIFRNDVDVTLQEFTVPYRILRLQLQPPAAALVMPVRNVPAEQVANTWHSPRPNGRNHQGVDIFARHGTPVFSVSEGIVTRIGTNTLGGNIVTITGAGGRSYYYAHLAKHAPDLAVGQTVHQNTVLGFVGNTGNARTTPPHLHLGVYAAGGAIDPLPLLVDRSVSRRRQSISMQPRSLSPSSFPSRGGV